MYDDEDYDYLDQEGHLANDKLVREGGVLIEPAHSQVDCNQQRPACAPDDYPEDPYSIDNRPGTVDDVGYSYGIESPPAADMSFAPMNSTHAGGERAPATERDLDLGEIDAEELWEHQEPLIAEDLDDGIKLTEQTTEAQAQRILDALGDDAAEPLSESGAGVSATGEYGSGENHGGFPERND